MSITKAAEILGVSRTLVYRLIAEGKLTPERHPLHKPHGPVRIPRDQVESLRSRHQETHGTS